MGVPEFDTKVKSEALTHLYLASLVGPSDDIFGLDEDEISKLSSKE